MLKIRGLSALVISVIFDLYLYIKHSSLIFVNNQVKLLALMTYNYHTLEKGLSMKSIRHGYGKQKVISLLERTKKYVMQGYDVNLSQFIASCSVLDKYYTFHQEVKYNISDYFSLSDYELIKKYSKENIGGTMNISVSDYFLSSKLNYRDFSLSRHSIRSFSTELIEQKKIERAINLAKHCPSACNRQSTKVYLIENSKAIKKILEIQKGINATANEVHQLLVITSNRNYFFTSGERYQIFVDGGIFIQSVLMSLHFEEIAACPLHWSLNMRQDNRIKEIVKFGSGEKVISLIAIGNLAQDMKVPASHRKEIGEIFNIVK